MGLYAFLSGSFKNGIQYDDAIALCIAMYSSSEFIPEGIDKTQASMDEIANAFAKISRDGLVVGYSFAAAVPYGANYHVIEDKGHWIEIIASIFKLKTSYDLNRVRHLIQTSTN